MVGVKGTIYSFVVTALKVGCYWGVIYAALHGPGFQTRRLKGQIPQLPGDAGNYSTSSEEIPLVLKSVTKSPVCGSMQATTLHQRL